MTSIRPRPFIHSAAATILTFFLLIAVTQASGAETVAPFTPPACETPAGVRPGGRGNARPSPDTDERVRTLAPGVARTGLGGRPRP